jgi:predicted ATPase/class 3 adenylate cyclase
VARASYAGRVGQTPVVATEVFLFTDIEGSTRRWAAAADQMGHALAVHDAVLASSLAASGGEVFKHTGDGLVVRFGSAPAAIAAAANAQRSLDQADWEGNGPLVVRMAIHAGEAESRGADWFGPALNRCARLLDLGHGGQILLSAAAHGLSVDGLAEGLSMLDLGEHLLRDLPNAEHVWQLEAPGLRRAFPPLRPLSDADGRSRLLTTVRLPEQLTHFHGRRAEGESVAALLTEERLVTLLGAGGIGKSRLALHVAGSALAAFPDGVWFCPLDDLVEDDPQSVPYAVADAIGVRPEEGATMSDTLARWIGQRRALVVLDNCEHVRAPAAALAGILLRACPTLTLLATSREPLRLPGEARVPLGPLDPAAAQALFVERLRSFDPFVAATVLTEDVAALCEQLGHMPLAIELAAARCRALSPAELAARLERRPALLVDRARPSAQQTLAAVLDWSVDQLDATARQVFARLSVFQGGCTLQQAEKVVAGGNVDELDVLDALGALVDVGLVSVASIAPVVRYSQLEPIRHHGARLLDTSDQTELARRHALAFAELATAIGRGLEGPDFGALADTADGELANVRAAHRWATHHREAEVAVGIVAGLREYLNERVMTEICDWNDATVAMARGRGDHLEAAALAAAAVGWFHQRRHSEAIDTFEQIRTIEQARPDLLAQAAAFAGWSSLHSHDRSDAEAFWKSGLAANPSPWHEGYLRASLGILSRTDRDLAVRVVERVNSPTLTAWFHIWKARILGPPERLAATEAVLAEVVEETSRIDATHPLGVALYSLGIVQAQLPDFSTKDVLALSTGRSCCGLGCGYRSNC